MSAEPTDKGFPQLSPELIGLVATNPFFMHNSSSRLQMYCSHIGQSLVVKGCTRKRLQSGLEREYAKFTFSIKMPCNGMIVKIIQKYPRTIGIGSIKTNPTTLIIYENLDHPQREIGVLELPTFHCIHQYYGFKYQYKPFVNTLAPGATIPEGTILADSPTVTEDGDYKFGLETKVAMMSIPEIVEDAMVISESYAKRLKTVGFGSRTVNFGSKRYPINLKGYGTLEEPKLFPEIGDRIRADGLLFALREYDDILSVVDLTPEAMQEPDYTFDKLVYAEPNAKVVDVIIHKGNQPRNSMPIGITGQIESYYSKIHLFYNQIQQEYFSLKKKIGDNLRLTPQFHNLVVESLAMCSDDTNQKIVKTFNRTQLDEWRVEIVYEYELTPTVGYKLTATSGDKGVVCTVWPDERMPVDKWGNRAEVITDADSTIKRMNVGRLYEQAINAAGDYIQRHIGLLPTLEAQKEFLMNFYRLLSPRMALEIEQSFNEEMYKEHIDSVIKEGVYLFMPTDSEVDYLEAIGEIKKTYPELVGPVNYLDDRGNLVTTTADIMIASMYFLMLEKTGNVWTGVASSKRQHFGIPAKLTNEDKYSKPGREQPVRFGGEAEVRLMTATVGGDVVADFLDRTNNPLVHREIVNNILKADKPTNIEKILDRNEFPIGNGRMQLYVKHFMECSGTRFVRK